MCLTEKNMHFVYIQEHIGMTNVKLLAISTQALQDADALYWPKLAAAPE
jgi:hypothetical protein